MTSNAYGPRKPRKVADTFTSPADATPAAEKKQSTTVWVPMNLNKQIRILAATHDTTQSDLVAEGMRMVIQKYSKE